MGITFSRGPYISSLEQTPSSISPDPYSRQLLCVIHEVWDLPGVVERNPISPAAKVIDSAPGGLNALWRRGQNEALHVGVPKVGKVPDSPVTASTQGGIQVPASSLAHACGNVNVSVLCVPSARRILDVRVLAVSLVVVAAPMARSGGARETTRGNLTRTQTNIIQQAQLWYE